MFVKSLLILILALGFNSGVLAADVAATLMKASGRGQLFLPGGGSGAFKAGTLVQPGSRIVTGEGALAVLMMGDGSRVSVGPNTDLTLAESRENGGERSTVFELVRGLFRATVQKLTVGSGFKVKTGTATVAVKGTEFEVSADEDGTEAKVSEGTVWLETAAGERAVLKERMAARAAKGAALGATRSLTDEETQNLRDWFKATHSPHSGARGAVDQAKAAAWARLRPDQRAQVWDDLRESLGDTWDDIVGLKAEERQERWRDRLRNSDERRLAAEGARVDFALGKTALDRQGRRVRFDEFLVRPNDTQVQFLNYTRRDNRVDVVSNINTYNRSLPQNLSEAPGMNQRIWRQGLGNAPQYWVTQSSLVAGNSSGDSFAATNTFYDPYFRGLYWELPIESSEIRLNIPDLQAPTLGGLQVEYWTRQLNGTPDGAGNSVLMPVATFNPLRHVSGSLNRLGDIAGTNLVWARAEAQPTTTLLSREGLEAQPGDLAFGFRRNYFGGQTLEFRNYVINENGEIVNLAGISPDQLMNEFVSRGLITSLKQIEIRSNQFKEADGINVVSKLLFLHDLSKSRDEL